MQTSLTTERLLIDILTAADSIFMLELVNTKGWIEFIGDRNVHSEEDALKYIQRIIDNPKITYWVVRIKNNNFPAGVISFIKRDYLDHPDIGFAFLPVYNKNGYAYEAAKAVLHSVISNTDHTHITATTIPSNNSSIKLLQRLGLQFDKEIEVENDKLQVFTGATDHLQITQLTNSFFDVFTNKNNRQPNFDLLVAICIPEILLIQKKAEENNIYTLASFIEPRKKILTNGSLTAFEEREIFSETKIVNNIAQRYCEYEKNGIADGKPFTQQGYKLLQFIKTNKSWKISSVTWEDKVN